MVEVNAESLLRAERGGTKGEGCSADLLSMSYALIPLLEKALTRELIGKRIGGNGLALLLTLAVTRARRRG